ncbi:MAG TPA: hypothetical protein VMD02_00155 [Candidatus Omnitrophota bacterium]|nr:hypothetical protein [Candidatus Omnitrophota bacterium]
MANEGVPASKPDAKRIDSLWTNFLKSNSSRLSGNEALLARIVKTRAESGDESVIYVRLNDKQQLVECKKGDTGAVEIDLTNGLDQKEADILGISLKSGINKVIAQGWKMDNDAGKQTGTDAVTIDYTELDQYDTTVRSYADAHGISYDQAVQLYQKTGDFYREDFVQVKQQREKAEGDLASQYAEWQKKPGNEKKAFADFLGDQGVPSGSPVLANQPAKPSDLTLLAFASRFTPELQKSVLSVKTPITTFYSGIYDAAALITWAKSGTADEVKVPGKPVADNPTVDKPKDEKAVKAPEDMELKGVKATGYNQSIKAMKDLFAKKPDVKLKVGDYYIAWDKNKKSFVVTTHDGTPVPALSNEDGVRKVLVKGIGDDNNGRGVYQLLIGMTKEDSIFNSSPLDLVAMSQAYEKDKSHPVTYKFEYATDAAVPKADTAKKDDKPAAIPDSGIPKGGYKLSTPTAVIPEAPSFSGVAGGKVPSLTLTPTIAPIIKPEPTLSKADKLKKAKESLDQVGSAIDIFSNRFGEAVKANAKVNEAIGLLNGLDAKDPKVAAEKARAAMWQAYASGNEEYRLGMEAEKKGDKKEADKHYKLAAEWFSKIDTAKEKDPVIKMYVLLRSAQLEEKQGNLVKAIALYQKVVALKPTDSAITDDCNKKIAALNAEKAEAEKQAKELVAGAKNLVSRAVEAGRKFLFGNIPQNPPPFKPPAPQPTVATPPKKGAGEVPVGVVTPPVPKATTPVIPTIKEVEDLLKGLPSETAIYMNKDSAADARKKTQAALDKLKLMDQSKPEVIKLAAEATRRFNFAEGCEKYRLGVEAKEAKKPAEAKKLFEEAAAAFERANVKDSDITFIKLYGLNRQAQSYEELGRTDDAIATYKKLIDAKPGPNMKENAEARIAELEKSKAPKPTVAVAKPEPPKPTVTVMTPPKKVAPPPTPVVVTLPKNVEQPPTPVAEIKPPKDEVKKVEVKAPTVTAAVIPPTVTVAKPKPTPESLIAEQKPTVDKALELAKAGKYDEARKLLEAIPAAKRSTSATAALEQIKTDQTTAKKDEEAKKAAEAAKLVETTKKDRTDKTKAMFERSEKLAADLEAKGDKASAKAIRDQVAKVKADIEMNKSSYDKDVAALGTMLTNGDTKLAAIKDKEVKAAAAAEAKVEAEKKAKADAAAKLAKKPVAGKPSAPTAATPVLAVSTAPTILNAVSPNDLLVEYFRLLGADIPAGTDLAALIGADAVGKMSTDGIYNYKNTYVKNNGYDIDANIINNKKIMFNGSILMEKTYADGILDGTKDGVITLAEIKAYIVFKRADNLINQTDLPAATRDKLAAEKKRIEGLSYSPRADAIPGFAKLVLDGEIELLRAKGLGTEANAQVADINGSDPQKAKDASAKVHMMALALMAGVEPKDIKVAAAQKGSGPIAGLITKKEQDIKAERLAAQAKKEEANKIKSVPVEEGEILRLNKMLITPTVLARLKTDGSRRIDGYVEISADGKTARYVADGKEISRTKVYIDNPNFPENKYVKQDGGWYRFKSPIPLIIVG